jgi:predicted XRE-type DNA-binding protein
MKEKIKLRRSTSNVFRDLVFRPIEAQNLLLRSDLMSRVERFAKSSNMTQKTAAIRLGVTAPRLNHLLAGKIEKFSLDALVNMLARVGIVVRILASKLPTRRAA